MSKMKNIENIEKKEVSTLEQLESYCVELAKKMTTKTVLLIDGPMGAGKTKTVQSLLSLMGFRGVTSPTFALHHSYRLPNIIVEHFDLYRIENLADLESTGFWDIFSCHKGWVIIEWSKYLVRNQLPCDWDVISVDIEFSGDDNRRFFTTKVSSAKN